MSRSRRKNPIIPVTSCCSERRDKQTWHRTWRRLERTTLTGASEQELESHLTRVRNEVSDVWTMSKDGHVYWPLGERTRIAEIHTRFEGRTPQERASLKRRILRKWMAK